MGQFGKAYWRWNEYTLLPCGTTGMSYAEARATIRRASVIPPHHVMSGCEVSGRCNYIQSQVRTNVARNPTLNNGTD